MVDEETSQRFRACILEGTTGIKPGWCRVGFHYVMDDPEANFVIDAVDFIAREGVRFLQLYNFEAETGAWAHRDERGETPDFSLQEAMASFGCGRTALGAEARQRRYAHALADAQAWAEKLGDPGPMRKLPGEAGELQFFSIPE